MSDNFPSSAAFDAISSALSNDAERKDAIKKGGAVFSFTLKNNGEEANWYIDLKDTGKVGQGAAPEGKNANGTTFNPLQDGTVLPSGTTAGERVALLLTHAARSHPDSQ